MAEDVRGYARLVLGKLHSQVEGRFAVAVRKTGEGLAEFYNVFYSDSQATDIHVTHEFLERLKRQGYRVIVTETPADREHPV